MNIEKVIHEGGTQVNYKLPLPQGDFNFNLPRFESPHALAGTAFETSLNVFAETGLVADQISNDARLSPLGRLEKIEPVYKNAISHLCGAWWQIGELEAEVARKENALFAVPKLEPTHAACAIEDREVRDFFRSLPPPERLQMIGRLQDSPEHERIQIAMLRSPIALLELEAKLLRKAWTESRRAASPLIAQEIDHGRESIEWGRRGLLTLGGLFPIMTRMKREDVIRAALLDENPRRATGYGVFGFSDSAAENEGGKLLRLGYRKDAEGLWKKAA